MNTNYMRSPLVKNDSQVFAQSAKNMLSLSQISIQSQNNLDFSRNPNSDLNPGENSTQQQYPQNRSRRVNSMEELLSIWGVYDQPKVAQIKQVDSPVKKTKETQLKSAFKKDKSPLKRVGFNQIAVFRLEDGKEGQLNVNYSGHSPGKKRTKRLQ